MKLKYLALSFLLVFLSVIITFAYDTYLYRFKVDSITTESIMFTAFSGKGADVNHPIQPIVVDERGVQKFKENKIVSHLLEFAQANKHDLNYLHTLEFSKDDWFQFNQLIGYSAGGIPGNLPAEVWQTVEKMTVGMSQEQAEVEALKEELKALRVGMSVAVSRLYGIHPNDLMDYTR